MGKHLPSKDTFAYRKADDRLVVDIRLIASAIIKQLAIKIVDDGLDLSWHLIIFLIHDLKLHWFQNS